MSTQLPDPQTLNSWEDAFQYPLPVVRKLEQQLRKNIDENRQKLRSLVGASYRDLLGTAETIIEMDESMEKVENLLADVGKKCNARTVGRIAENHGRMRMIRETQDVEHMRVMVQTKILQSCLKAAARLVRDGGDALLAAKLLVLSRLLHKEVSECRQPPPILEKLRHRLNTLRARLLSYIDQRLVSPITDKHMLAQILSAYAFITSSNPKEVLRHFLQIRYNQLETVGDTLSESDILQSLDLYSRTITEARDLFPKRLAEALARLSHTALLHDEQITSIPELNLDIYGQWIADNIRKFTPWSRHDQLLASDVGDALTAWTKQAQRSLLDRLRSHLENQGDAREIVQSRRKFISKFIGLSSRLRHVTSRTAVQDLREMFLARLQVLAIRSADLDGLLLGENDVAHLVAAQSRDSTLWSLASEDFQLDHGALKLRQSILSRKHGRDEGMRSELAKLDAWVSRVSGFLDIIDTMKTTKWEEDFDIDLEDTEDADDVQRALSKDDPSRLKEALRTACSEALRRISQSITAAAHSTKYPTHYLRLWRELSTRRRAIGSRLELEIISISLLELYRNIAQAISEDAIRDYISSAKNGRRPTVMLWEGTPPLPSQPSPQVFGFLTSLHRAMANAGVDLWSAPCVGELKAVVLSRLGREFGTEKFTGKMDKPDAEISTNGHAAHEAEAAVDGESQDQGTADGGDQEENIINGEDEEKGAINGAGDAKDAVNGDGTSTSRENDANDLKVARLLQNLFDLYYLSRILEGVQHDLSASQDFDAAMKAIKADAGVEEAADERLKKSAGEYWKRTYLLFGLLAGRAGHA